MYHYIYDAFLADQKFSKALSAIENRLTDLGIYGSVHRLALFKTMKGTIHDAVRRGAKTIVAVGDDSTVAKAIDAIAAYPGVVFGVIPIGQTRTIADLLGVPREAAACDVLSARLVEELDLGKVNNHYFLTSLEVPGQALVECDGLFTVSPVAGGQIKICNLAAGERCNSNPRDGRLETLVKTMSRGFLRPSYAAAGVSVFPTQKVVVRPIAQSAPVSENGMITAVADGQSLSDAEFHVEIVPKCLKVIVGKGRAI